MSEFRIPPALPQNTVEERMKYNCKACDCEEYTCEECLFNHSEYTVEREEAFIKWEQSLKRRRN